MNEKSFNDFKKEIEHMFEELKSLRSKEHITSEDLDIMEEMSAWIRKSLEVLEKSKVLN